MAQQLIAYTSYLGAADAPRGGDLDFALPSPPEGSVVRDDEPLYGPLLRWLRDDWLLGLAAAVALSVGLTVFGLADALHPASAAAAEESKPAPAMLSEAEAAATFEGGRAAAAAPALAPTAYDQPPESIQARPAPDTTQAPTDSDTATVAPADADATTSDTTQP